MWTSFLGLLPLAYTKLWYRWYQGCTPRRSVIGDLKKKKKEFGLCDIDYKTESIQAEYSNLIGYLDSAGMSKDPNKKKKKKETH